MVAKDPSTLQYKVLDRQNYLIYITVTMAKTNRARDLEDDPVSLGDRAAETLKFIRETMEGSSRFTAVPGYGGMLMGVTAIAAAYIANNYAPLRQDWLITWLVEAVVAFAIGLAALWHKASRADAS